MTTNPSASAAASENAENAGTAGTAEVFWRPGCPYCISLRHALKRDGTVATWRNIWEDDEARAFVRSVNNGNETVPTVRVGDKVATNPSGAQVAAMLGREDGQKPSKIGSWLRR